MGKIEIPECLTPVGEANFKKIRSLIPGNALFFFDDMCNQTLKIFRTPFNFVNWKGSFGIENFGDNMKNLGWYVRRYQPREKSDSGNVTAPYDQDIWDDFSEMSIVDKLRDKSGEIYEIKCDQVFSESAQYGINPKDAYFLNTHSRNVKSAFYFGAKELLSRLDSSGFSDGQVKKLTNIFYEDFKNMGHSNKSREIGKEADSVFF